MTREVSGSSYTQQLINVNPNTIFFFGTSSTLLTSSALDITSSISVSSSYALTSSYALNGGGGQGSATSASWASSSLSSSYVMTTIYALNTITASTGTIPINLSFPDQILNITASTNISFSCVSSSTANIVQDTAIYVNNSSATNTGLYFPTNWIGLGGGLPLTLTASKSAMVIMRSINNSPNIILGFNVQL